MVKYLQKIGLITGPLERNTSHSGLESLRRSLLGEPQFQGGEEFLKFGTALHEVFLENKFDTYKTLPAWQQEKIDKMVIKLNSHPVVRRLIANSIKEDKQYKKLNGVLMAYILDIKQAHKSTGADLKTTTCTTFHDCIKKSIEYGYVKQGKIYMKMEKLKEFYFIFINKSEPFDIHIVSYKEFKNEEVYAEKELEFLSYFYSKYGRFVTEDEKLNQNNMTTSKGKEAITVLQNAVKEHKIKKTSAHKLLVSCEKSSINIQKLVKKFPKDEFPLYKEKIDSLVKSI